MVVAQIVEEGYKGYKDGLQPETLADGNWLVKQNQPVSKVETKSDTNSRSLYESWFRNALISISVILWWQAKKGINSEHEGANARSLKHSFKKVSISHAQLAHFSTLAKEKHMLLILNFSTLTFITNARTTMQFARLHSQMVRTQSEPAKIPQHMFVQILVQVGGDRKRRTSRTTLRTPTPLVIRHCFLVNCARTWKISFPPYLQMSETQIANELLHGNLCGTQHLLFENCTTLQSIERIRDLSRPARTIKKSKKRRHVYRYRGHQRDVHMCAFRSQEDRSLFFWCSIRTSRWVRHSGNLCFLQPPDATYFDPALVYWLTISSICSVVC
jgi:hypothetical protein